jgi:hypothetical protein
MPDACRHQATAEAGIKHKLLCVLSGAENTASADVADRR